MNIIVSFSGGRTSAYMLYRLMQEYPEDKLHVVFANTGKEYEETLVFVRECELRFGIKIHWIEAKVNPEKGVGTEYTAVDFKSASRLGQPFEEVIKKYGMPGMGKPHCSRELKIVPIRKWANDAVGSNNYEMAIGMRYDEMDRVADGWYPLVEWRVTKQMVREFWKSQDFDLQLPDYKGNCDLCWKKSLNKKLTIIEQEPESVEWWDRIEKQYGNGHIMSRGFVSYEQQVKLVERGKFRRVLDGEVNPQQSALDFELKCTCGVP